MPSVEHGSAQPGLSGALFGFRGPAGGGPGPGGWWLATEVEVAYESHETYRHDVVGWRRGRVAANRASGPCASDPTGCARSSRPPMPRTTPSRSCACSTSTACLTIGCSILMRGPCACCGGRRTVARGAERHGRGDRARRALRCRRARARGRPRHRLSSAKTRLPRPARCGRAGRRRDVCPGQQVPGLGPLMFDRQPQPRQPQRRQLLGRPPELSPAGLGG